MIEEIEKMLKKNRAWAKESTQQNPQFFTALSEEQKPFALWIGCADSRVPAELLTNSQPGELFVHRNIANLVYKHDTNCMAVIQYAIEILNIKHIIVCGHYGCGGVKAVVTQQKMTTQIQQWLKPLYNIAEQHDSLLAQVEENEKVDLLCRLNVIEQIYCLGKSDVVQSAWQHKKALSLYGLVYGLKEGHLLNLKIVAYSPQSLKQQYQTTIAAIQKHYLQK